MISSGTLKKKKPFSSGKNCPICHAADNRIALIAVSPIPIQRERIGIEYE
jgi:Zn ribbon nucleic-acid-binding protein